MQIEVFGPENEIADFSRRLKCLPTEAAAIVVGPFRALFIDCDIREPVEISFKGPDFVQIYNILNVCYATVWCQEAAFAEHIFYKPAAIDDFVLTSFSG